MEEMGLSIVCSITNVKSSNFVPRHMSNDAKREGEAMAQKNPLGRNSQRERPLLLLHGFTGRGDNWNHHTEYFTRAGYTVLTPDLPGHGANLLANPHDYTIKAAAAQIAGLLDSEKTGPVHLLGYSMGGRLALYFALHYPEKVDSLILESASPGLATPEERAVRKASDDALAERIEREGIPAFVAFWEGLPLWKSQERLPAATRQWLHEKRLCNDPMGLAHSLRQMGTGVQPSLWERLEELKMPVLLLAGEEDKKFVALAQEMAARVPQARLKILAEAGHTLHLEQPDTFQKAVLEFTTPSSPPISLLHRYPL